MRGDSLPKSENFRLFGAPFVNPDSPTDLGEISHAKADR